MPFQMDWSRHRVVVYFWGSFDKKVSTEAFEKIVDSPRAVEIKSILWDLSKITRPVISEEESMLTAIACQLHRKSVSPMKMAFFILDSEPRRLPRIYSARYHLQDHGWTFLVSNDFSLITSWLDPPDDNRM